MAEQTILSMREIHKCYGGIQALNAVNLELNRGEVLCLLGENGAGKSTLMKILSGAERPDRGEILIEGEPVAIHNPKRAHELGISTVYQELIQIPDMSISENIFTGRYPLKLGLIDKDSLIARTVALMRELGVQFDPETRVRRLSIAQRQLVEIMKAVSYDSRIIVFDEPTSSLTQDETEMLFRIIGYLKGKGTSIIYISHRLEETFRIGDRVLVLRDGMNAGQGAVAELDQDLIISMMVGRAIENQFPKQAAEPGDVVLRVEDVRNARLKGCGFVLRRGEILGFGGLVGSGRTELMRAIFGLDESEGAVFLEDDRLARLSPSASLAKGIALVPEDRKEQGLVLGLEIRLNMVLSSMRRFSRLLFTRDRQEIRTAEDFIGKLKIRTTGCRQQVQDLSGGNQQKVVLARCLITRPKVLILDEPTRGIDVGSKVEIYQIMNELVLAGVAIIMVSSELPELLAMSDRIIVMREGAISGELARDEADEEAVMRLAVKGA